MFTPGQKVVCICDKWDRTFATPSERPPVNGEIYTVSVFSDIDRRFLPIIGLVGMKDFYEVDAFRAVDDTFGEWVADRIETLLAIEEAEKDFL